jgi:hypothetical protein
MAIIPATLVALAACGGNDDDEDDPRRPEISGVAQLAVNAWASSGAGALHDYVSSEVAGRCSPEQIASALDGEAVPTGFRELRNVDFGGDSSKATIVVTTEAGEKELVWTYVLENDRWRISEMPSLEGCAP